MASIPGNVVHGVSHQAFAVLLEPDQIRRRIYRALTNLTAFLQPHVVLHVSVGLVRHR